MIDPNILLQSKPVDIETPQAAAVGAQTLTNLGNTGLIQQGTIAQQAATVAGTEQENQQRQIALDNQKATNAAIAGNIKTGADGKPFIDHSGVVTSLTQAGKGVAALDYQKNATAIQQGVATLQEANQKLAQAHTESIASVAGAVDSATTPAAKAAIYAMGIQSLEANHQIQPGSMPETYDPSMDDKIKGWAKMGQTSQQQTQDANAASLAASSAKRADVLEDRAATYQESVDNKADADNWKPNGSRNGQALYFNAKTGAERVGGAIDLQPDKPGRGDSLTAGQQAIQDRADAKAFSVDRKTLDGIHAQRTALGVAMSVENGDTYNDPKTGKPVGEMTDAVRAGLKAQLSNLTNQGQRLQSDMGIPNEFADVTNGSAPVPAPAAAPKAAAPAGKPVYSKFATNGKQRLGLNTATNKWEPVQ